MPPFLVTPCKQKTYTFHIICASNATCRLQNPGRHGNCYLSPPAVPWVPYSNGTGVPTKNGKLFQLRFKSDSVSGLGLICAPGWNEKYKSLYIKGLARIQKGSFRLHGFICASRHKSLYHGAPVSFALHRTICASNINLSGTTGYVRFNLFHLVHLRSLASFALYNSFHLRVKTRVGLLVKPFIFNELCSWALEWCII